MKLFCGWKRRGRWDALNHPLVRPLTQLPAESFVGLLFWTSLANFLRCIYWLQLRRGGASWDILYLSYLFVPGTFLWQALTTSCVYQAQWL